MAQIPWCEAMTNNIGPLDTPPDSCLGVSDATWMDDLVMFLTSHDASSLLGNLQVGASTLLDACLQRALVPNLTRGKTEAIIHVLGPGAQKIRSKIFGPEGGSLPLHCKLWPEARLRVVPVYRHLGGYLQHNGGLKQEIAFRTSQAWDAFNKRKKKLFQSPLVSANDKAVYFNSLISTVLFHGAGTWTSIADQHITSIEATLRQIACQMLRPQFSADEAWHLGTMQVLARAGIPRCGTYLHVARLRHLLACIQLCVPELWALAHWERHWLDSVRSSVRWLWDILDGGSKYRDWQAAWAEWRVECRTHPGRWKAKIRNSVTCRRTLLGTPHRINPLPGIGSKKAPKEHLFCAPTLQAAGPRPSATGDYVDDELDRPAAEVLDCLAHLDFDGHSHAFSPDVVWERVRQAFSCVCLPARRLLLTARVWQTQLDQSPPDNPESTPFHTFLLEVAQWVVAADFADWLAPAPAVRAAYVPTFLHSRPRLCLLDLTGVSLPQPEEWTDEHVLICIGQWPIRGLEDDAVPDPIIYTHSASLTSLAEGKELDFLGDLSPETGFVINTCGLPAPCVDSSGDLPHFEDALSALRLSCDLVCLQGADRATFWVGQQNSLIPDRRGSVPSQSLYSRVEGLPRDFEAAGPTAPRAILRRLLAAGIDEEFREGKESLVSSALADLAFLLDRREFVPFFTRKIFRGKGGAPRTGRGTGKRSGFSKRYWIRYKDTFYPNTKKMGTPHCDKND
ncbi:CPK1 [Symbiodinium sp. KB8]|nr:CPK1 [Symbiodinium sp. KB8]